MFIDKSIFSVASEYDTLFVDVYGVLFDGAVFYEETLYTLKRLHDSGKKIVILSNSTQLSADAILGFAKNGAVQGTHFDHFITAGEFLHNTLLYEKDVLNAFAGKQVSFVKCLFADHPSMFSGTDVIMTDHIDQADLVYVGPPKTHRGVVRVDSLVDEKGGAVGIEEFLNRDWRILEDDQGRRDLSEFHYLLESLAKNDKGILVANSDVFAPYGVGSARYLILTQGGIGSYYKKFFNGRVLHFGKPQVGIYQFAKKMTSSEDDKILMIGDTLWTDILGAYRSGVDSALVMTGITEEFFNAIPAESTEEKLKVLSEQIGPKISGLSEALQVPTYLLRRFGDMPPDCNI